MTNEPARPTIHNHRCSVHGQVMQAPKSFRVTCGKCGRVCTPDTEPA
jgi:hypothetical protein